MRQHVEISFQFSVKQHWSYSAVGITFKRPAHNFRATLDYSQLQVETVRMFPFITGGKKLITDVGPDAPGRHLEVHADGWILLGSGVCFTWARF